LREAVLQRRFLDWLTKQGIYYVKVVVASKSGVPDALLCIRGCFVAIEFKRTTGEATPLQIYNMEKIEEAGGVAWLLKPENVSDIKRSILKLNSKE
jgi:hypothetical protein